MGFFSKFFGSGKKLNTIANGVANITVMLDNYMMDFDESYLYMSAWIFRVAILDVVEKNNFPPSFFLFAPIRGHLTKITIAEAFELTIDRIKKLAQREETLECVNDIIKRGKYFYELDNSIPADKKKIFM